MSVVSEENLWRQQIAANPGHSQWYIDRFRAMVDQGKDIVGEARTVDAMVGRGAQILDAGCGPGRIGGHLASVGHVVVGVDLDPELIEAARADHPAAQWICDDLATVDLGSYGITTPFDVVVCAGNVLTFVAPSTRRDVLAGFARVLADDGRVVAGFGAGRGYGFDDFFADAAAVGLRAELNLSTWDLRPFTDDADFLVSVLTKQPAASAGDEPGRSLSAE